MPPLFMPRHPIRHSMMLWIRHVSNTNLLILILLSKSSFCYLSRNILFRNSQNLYLVIVSNSCPFLPAIHHFVRFVYGWFYICKWKRIVPMITTESQIQVQWPLELIWWFVLSDCWIAPEQGQMHRTCSLPRQFRLFSGTNHPAVGSTTSVPWRPPLRGVLKTLSLCPQLNKASH